MFDLLTFNKNKSRPETENRIKPPLRTSSGSMSLNSMPRPVQVMAPQLAGSCNTTIIITTPRPSVCSLDCDLAPEHF